MRDLGQVPPDTLGLTVAKAIRLVRVVYAPCCCAGLGPVFGGKTKEEEKNQPTWVGSRFVKSTSHLLMVAELASAPLRCLSVLFSLSTPCSRQSRDQAELRQEFRRRRPILDGRQQGRRTQHPVRELVRLMPCLPLEQARL